MPPATSSIPRFLLPQLTWKATFPKSLALTNQKVACAQHPAIQYRSLYRAASHQVETSHHDNYKPYRPSTSRPIYHSPLRPSAPSSLLPTLFCRLTFHKPFSTTVARSRDHHFDTLKFVQRLKDEGFSEEQSKAMMLVLSDVIEESIQNLTRTMVLREDADRSTYTQKVDFTKLRSELLALDSSDTTTTLASHERLSNDLTKLSARVRDEISRAQASVKLDLNLEKGRIREEAKGQELKIKETETRIEQEVAGLRERVEMVKFSTLQWLMGVCTGTAALILGAWRLLM